MQMDTDKKREHRSGPTVETRQKASSRAVKADAKEGKTGRPRGFASMDEAKQREIARKGGKAAHEKGAAHEFTPEEARVAGRKGGEVVSENRQHMAEIGRKGGRSSGDARAAKRMASSHGEEEGSGGSGSKRQMEGERSRPAQEG